MRERLEAALAGRYTIERELGRGGMATVWLARDLRHERPVAIKVLHDELAGAIGVDRFVREVRLTARLQHPGIVSVLDSGVLPANGATPLPWYAMPYVQGMTLRQRLVRDVQLPVEEAIAIARDVAAALAAAHASGIVHRDIKPENVMLAEGRALVVDFGIARALVETGDERLTRTGLAIGTPAYMSPEQATASRVDARADQFALAAMLYEMLCGEPPATGPTAQAIVARRLSEPARPIRPVRPTVPLHVEAAVLRALERVPADRFPDVGSFAKALEGDASHATHPVAASPRRALHATVAGLAVFAIVGVAAWSWRGGAPAAPPRDPEVLRLHQRGMRGYESRTPAGVADAVTAFQAAIARDSSYGPAWAGLARTFVRVFERRFPIPGIPRDSAIRLALEATERALSLDSLDAQAWASQAALTRIVDPTDVGPSMRAARRAIALDSSQGPAWHFLALGLAESGRMDEALAAWREGARRAPRHTLGLAFLAIGHYWRGQYDSAVTWADSARSVEPNHLLGWTVLGQALVERGEHDRAIAAFEAARRLSTDVEVINALALRAYAEARAGRAVAARTTLRLADSLAAARPAAPLHAALNLAQARAALGESAAALEWVARSDERRDLHYQVHLRCDPGFAPLARDARFGALVIGEPRPGAC